MDLLSVTIQSGSRDSNEFVKIEVFLFVLLYVLYLLNLRIKAYHQVRLNYKGLKAVAEVTFMWPSYILYNVFNSIFLPKTTLFITVFMWWVVPPKIVCN